MQRSTRTNLILVVIAAALGAVAWWQVRGELAGLEPALATIDTGGVTRIHVQCAGCVERSFARTPGGWRMTSPYLLDADPVAIARLLAIPASPVRLREPADAYVPAKIGLDPATITLELDDLRIEFGTTDALRGDRYVRDGARIARVPDRFSPFLMAAPESELDRHLVPRGARITALHIDGIDAAGRIAAWQEAAASRISAAAADAGATATRRIDMQLADGSTLAWRLGQSADGWIARRASPALDYHLDARTAAALLHVDTP